MIKKRISHEQVRIRMLLSFVFLVFGFDFAPREGLISAIPGLAPSLRSGPPSAVQIRCPADLSNSVCLAADGFEPYLEQNTKGLGLKSPSPYKFLAPRLSRDTKRPRVADPEVWFRVVHVTMQDDEAFHEQTVEVTLGPKGAFEKENIGVIKRRVPTDGVVNSLLPQIPLPQKIHRPPRVVELLRKAMEWKKLLESRESITQADIAKREGFSRPRVTQIMNLLNLAHDIQKHILSMPETDRKPVVTERALRPILKLGDPAEQLVAFRSLSASE